MEEVDKDGKRRKGDSMANLKQVASNIKARYKKWDDGSKERERRKLEKIQGKRAKEALSHVYQMERARRKYELEEQLLKIKVMELKRKHAESQAKKLSSGSILGKLFSDQPKRKKRR